MRAQGWLLVVILVGLLTGCTQGTDLQGIIPRVTPVPTPVLERSEGVETASLVQDPGAVPAAPGPTSTVVPENARVERGRVVFAGHCLECHGDEGQGVPGFTPPYSGLTEHRIKTVVRYGLTIACCQFMAPTPEEEISDEDIQAIIEYIKTVQPKAIVEPGQ